MQISKMVLKLSVALATGLVALSAHAEPACNGQVSVEGLQKSPSHQKKEARLAKNTAKPADTSDAKGKQ
jgi:hypothetical protein